MLKGEKKVSIDLSNKVAIITGAGRGIGEAIAKKLAKAGADVHICDKNLDNLTKVAQDINDENEGKAFANCLDVSDEEKVTAFSKSVIDSHGRVDVLVNVAGINIIRRFEDTTSEEFQKILDVNLKGTYNTCRSVVEQMIKQGGGVILNTASEAAVQPFDYHSMYCASKYGVIGLSHVMALELGRHNIKVNCLCPGTVKTEMWDTNLKEMGRYENIVSFEDRFEEEVSAIPLKRPQTTEDMANAALFLCSDMSENISGQSMLVNGAFICR